MTSNLEYLSEVYDEFNARRQLVRRQETDNLRARVEARVNDAMFNERVLIHRMLREAHAGGAKIGELRKAVRAYGNNDLWNYFWVDPEVMTRAEQVRDYTDEKTRWVLGERDPVPEHPQHFQEIEVEVLEAEDAPSGIEFPLTLTYYWGGRAKGWKLRPEKLGIYPGTDEYDWLTESFTTMP